MTDPMRGVERGNERLEDIEQEGEELHVDPDAEPNPDEPIDGADELPDIVGDGDVDQDYGPGEGEDEVED